MHELYVSACTCVHVDKETHFSRFREIEDKDFKIRDDSSFLALVVNSDSII
jgi:hypothetical protein